SDSGAESEISTLAAKFSVNEITPGANIGSQSVGTNDDSQSADLAQVSSTSTGAGGKIISAFGYISGQSFGTGDQQIRVVVYTDSAGAPGTLLGYSSTISIADGAAYAWVEFPFISNVVLPPGSVV